MPWFVMIGHDGPRGRELRRRTGPRTSPASSRSPTPGGSAMRVRCSATTARRSAASCCSRRRDLAEARAIAARDPYVTQGIFARYEVRETAVVFPR
jgi:hypothetical protein